MAARTLSGPARRELVDAVRVRYRISTPTGRRLILREFVAISGYHRKSAIRILNGDADENDAVALQRRPRVYDEAFCRTLVVLWEASDRVCGKRLRALLPSLVPALERHGHLALESVTRTKLLGVSAATIDRLLAEARGLSDQRRRRHAPTVLRRSVPIRTYADWNAPDPGFLEIDLVAHCGDRLTGAFVHTLTLTDVASTWTECVPLLVREGTLVVETIDQLRGSLPFALRGLDVDNGSEFLNEALVRYCVGHGIELTRSRPYRKNDQAWVEQKNGSVVRRLVGYRRLEGAAAAAVLARLYTVDRRSGAIGCASSPSEHRCNTQATAGACDAFRGDPRSDQRQSAQAKRRSAVRVATPEPLLFGTMVRLRWVIVGSSSRNSSC